MPSVTGCNFSNEDTTDRAMKTDPTLEYDFTPESTQPWLNTGIFGARCYAAGVLGPYEQIANSLRLALEEDLKAVPKADVKDCRI